jgi:hypothetical protein
MVPKLLHERLPEMGIDYSIVYPTHGLSAARSPEPEERRAVVRGYNAYYADIVREFGDRLTIPAVVPMNSPAEAIEELEHATGLGLKAAMFGGHVVRDAPDGPSIDVLALESAYDYDPLWQRCVELGIAVTIHSGAHGVGFRTSGNYMYNHIGHFADSGHAAAKALVMGGVTRRFPTLNFAFLEGGAAWGVSLLADLIGRWEKRGGTNIFQLSPEGLDVDRFHALLAEHGGARYATDAVRQSLSGLHDGHPEHLDDFWRAEVKSAEDLVELFVPRFYFGCEADDPTNAWAFATSNNPYGARLRAVLGSDLGHWDVPDMAAVLGEAFELVEHGVISAADFRDFAADNAIRLHGGMNAAFFDGTAVQAYAGRVLE